MITSWKHCTKTSNKKATTQHQLQQNWEEANGFRDINTVRMVYTPQHINKYYVQQIQHMDDTVAARKRDGIKGRYEEGEVPINSLLINHDEKVLSIHRRESQFHGSRDAILWCVKYIAMQQVNTMTRLLRLIVVTSSIPQRRGVMRQNDIVLYIIETPMPTRLDEPQRDAVAGTASRCTAIQTATIQHCDVL